MKSLLAVAAFGCGLALARRPLPFPFYGNRTSSSGVPHLFGSGTANCTSAANGTSAAVAITSSADSTGCSCSASVITTTVYVFAPDTGPSGIGLPTSASATERASTNSDTYWFSIFNGATAWGNGITPPTDTGTTFYFTSTVLAIPVSTDVTTTEVTFTITDTRTLTSTVASALTQRTETVVVTEVQVITTTIHRSFSASSSAAYTASADSSGVIDSVSALVSVPEPASESAPAAAFGSIAAPLTVVNPSVSFKAPAITESISVIGGSGITCSESSSSQLDVTVSVTSFHTITLSPTLISLIAPAGWNGTLSWNSTRSFALDDTIPVVTTLTVSGPTSTEWVMTDEVPTPTFPSFSPTGVDGLTFTRLGTGTQLQVSGTNVMPSICSSSVSSAEGVPCFSYGQTLSSTSTQASDVSTRFRSNIASAFASVSSTVLTFPESTISSTYGGPLFLNSTTAGPVATQSSLANATSSAVPRKSTSALSGISPGLIAVTSLTPNTTSASHFRHHGNSTTSSSASATTTILPISSTYGLTSPENSREGSGVATQLPNDSISSSVGRESSMSLTLVPSTSYRQTPANLTKAGGITTQSTSSFSLLTSSRVSILSTSPPSTAIAPLGYGQIPPYPTLSATIASSATDNPTATVCGEIGNFTMSRDGQPLDLHTIEDDLQYAPVFNLYHRLFSSSGVEFYSPENSISRLDPYDPVSEPNVAIFHTHGSIPIANRHKSYEFGTLPGTIGAGPRANDRTYWFNVYSAELGCDNGGSDLCNVTISGYLWNKSSRKEDKVATQTARIQPCSQLEDCKLEHVALNGFEGLSSVRFEAIVDGATLKSWVVDNLNMGWYDNSCEAGLKRVSVNK